MQRRSGLTLVELLVVLVILIALAGILIPFVSGNLQISLTPHGPSKTPQQIVTLTTMERLRDTIVGTPERPGYWNDMLTNSGDVTQTPATIKDLFVFNAKLNSSLQTFNPNTRRGWRGPYFLSPTGSYPDPTNAVVQNRGFTSSYGQKNDPALLDAWGNPILIQWVTDNTGNYLPQDAAYVRLVSAGPNGKLETAATVTDLSRTSPAWNVGDDIILYLRLPLSSP